MIPDIIIQNANDSEILNKTPEKTTKSHNLLEMAINMN